MSGSKLLEQAIVDAQALRDSAYKSAQAALVEKFAPQIKEAVEKLLEQAPEEEPAGMAGSPEDAMAADIPGGTDFGGAPPDTSDKSYVAGAAKNIPLAATDGEKLCACPDNDKEIVLNLDLGALADELNVPSKNDDEEEMNMQPMAGMQDQPSAAGGANQLEESLELELDESLDETIKEVNLDELLSESEEVEDEDDEEESDESEEDEESDEDEQDEHEESEEHEKSEKEDEEDLDEAKKKKASTKQKELSPPQQKIAMAHDNPPKGPKGDEKIDAKDLKALRDKKQNTNESKTKQLLQASAQLLKEHQNSIKIMEKKDAKIHNLLEENNKLTSTVEEMSLAFKKLEEVNTLNAKLFYENQVLKSASLNERQKTHIVEAISKADSVSEAKTMYETLINSVGGPQREERSPKSLNEAINKKSSFRMPHKQTEQPNDPNKDRWLKLAGIK